MPEKVHVIRNVSPIVEQKIEEKFKGQPSKGSTSPQQAWKRALLHIAALDPDLSIQIYSLWQRSLQIAQTRNDSYLRDENKIREKYADELIEIQEVKDKHDNNLCVLMDVLNRASNIVYYRAQLYAYDGHIDALIQALSYVQSLIPIPQIVLLRIANAKYAERASRATSAEPKDISREYRVMQRVLDEYVTSQNI